MISFFVRRSFERTSKGKAKQFYTFTAVDEGTNKILKIVPVFSKFCSFLGV